ncbi:sulfatase-like hydrolase/transferase [Candidimonas humi]|uniref:Sulfatase n=1 Tax=Candidimonas humi TaxID=683355 RepID=A0ABV8NZS4_9BURK|nr:sulfatase-like hydrolase/transferase [Candidimonas humi]MBV6304117.1 sulfatase-like hydrolase/transferase [Candidimonas humi]
MTTKRPNFLLFITDQHKADHLGAYGNPVLRTPNLDALAARGWKAENFNVATPICMPNRSSLMTGRMPSVHGARHNGIPLSLQATTFVEKLRDHGYRTALVGKSHLQNMTGIAAKWPRPQDPRTEGEARHPQGGNYDQEWAPFWRNDPDHDMELPFYGFSRVALTVDHGDQVQGHYWRWLEENHPEAARSAGPEQAIPTPEYELSRFRQAWRTRVPEELSTNGYIGMKTRELIREYAQGEQPFFIQCSFPDPHHPFTPHGKYWGMYRPEEVDLPASFHASQAHTPPAHVAWLYEQRDRAAAVKNTPALFSCTEREAREAIALNYGSISHIDHVIGEVMAELRDQGLADDTVVIFMSDHGDYLGDHQLLWKGPIHYRSLIRTPFIWMDPANPQARHNQDALASTIDVAATVLERSGVLPYNGIQGQSLLPLMDNRRSSLRDHLLIEEEGQRVMFGLDTRVRMRTLVDGRHRLSLYEKGAFGELYDLQEDPMELVNLWDAPAHAARKSALLEALALAMIDHTDTSPNPTAIA